MTKQSVNFTSPNDDWLNAKVASKEYSNKTDVINDLIRREREREEKFQALKAAIEEGLASGISENSVPDIMKRVEKRMIENGTLPDTDRS
ncbi:MAG TPA: type II toxin-antitoxin system ParD family antitoxin [Nitrosomonas mobilis]|nr:type II toxin-antitoxin system ParD family antitoxin [Nitrosomonas mobilis]